MSNDVQAGVTPKWMLWTGWIVSILPALMLIMSGVMKLMKPPDMAEGMSKLGWDMELALGLAITELACVAIYLFPPTAVLGAILLTGYLGGAIATHVRIGDPFFIPIIVGVVIWGGLWLRDARVRALLPVRR